MYKELEIEYCGYFTENISEFLIYHSQPLPKNCSVVTPTIFSTNFQNLSEIPEDALLCTVDVVRLYPNIPREEGLRRTERST